MERYLSAQEAADQLGISLPTLYAYVSRGLIRSEAVGGSKRNRRYNAEDVQRLLERKEGRRNPDKLAESALHFGTPLLDSAITLISDGHLYYRGQDAIELAQTQTIEAVAALLWTGEIDMALPESHAVLPPAWAAISEQVRTLSLFERFQVLLPLAGAQDVAAYDLRPAAVIQTGARILRLLTQVVVGTATSPLAVALQDAWCPEIPDCLPLLNAALIVCADHELNVSSFTARCVASAGSTPYAAVSAGLAALQGTKHGGNTSRVEALLREVGQADHARQVIAERLKRGEGIPGFGHRLYPEGDPRARLLLGMLAGGDSLTQAVIEAVDEFIGEPPNIDFALVTLAQTLQLPPGAPLALFALGRTVGW
ncbi:MAG: citrate synthase family protein, partial [Anaerolineae bacterium]|nr:citrate synthase family protein [Anaerolineae bacterium]